MSNTSAPINLFDQPVTCTVSDKEQIQHFAEKFYEQIQEFYMFLIDSITAEDYVNMQKEFHYVESYEEHKNSLTEGIPEKETTINCIIDFLCQYQEFVNDEYVSVLKKLNEKLHHNKELCKLHAYKILQKHSKDNQQSSYTKGFTQSNMNFSIQNTKFTLNTYSNPLLVSLYGLLMTWFSLKYYRESPSF